MPTRQTSGGQSITMSILLDKFHCKRERLGLHQLKHKEESHYSVIQQGQGLSLAKGMLSLSLNYPLLPHLPPTSPSRSLFNREDGAFFPLTRGWPLSDEWPARHCLPLMEKVSSVALTAAESKRNRNQPKPGRVK